MQRGFTKLFNSIVTSTIWQEDDQTRIVWITMLAIADQHGIVSASLPGLASVANVTLDACEKAIKNLEAPDEYSRTKDLEGRRIQPMDGGWIIINYDKYRKMMSEEERKEYKAKWIKAKRRQMSTMLTDVDASRQESTSVSASSSISSSSYLEELKRNPFNAGVDINAELEKAKSWCRKKGRRCTQRFFTKWVERADRLVPDLPKKDPIPPPVAPPSTPEEDEQRKIVLGQQMKELRDKMRMPQ